MKTKNLQKTAMALLAFGPACAIQAQSFDVGTNAINAGIGLGGYRYSYVNSYNDRYTISPTLCASYERGVTELGPGVLGIGGFFARKTVKYEWSEPAPCATCTAYNYDRRWSNTIIGLRGSWHFNEWHGSDRFDLYGGLMLGYNIGSYKNQSTQTRNGVTQPLSENYGYSLSFVTWSSYLGGRYFFSEKVGAYLELGYGIAYLNLGATFKF